jgi:uncharacterized protein (DUF952 family)
LCSQPFIMAEDEAPVIFVKGVCKLCSQQVWNNELRWKSYTPAGEYEGYVHKACHDQLHQKVRRLSSRGTLLVGVAAMHESADSSLVRPWSLS